MSSRNLGVYILIDDFFSSSFPFYYCNDNDMHNLQGHQHQQLFKHQAKVVIYEQRWMIFIGIFMMIRKARNSIIG